MLLGSLKTPYKEIRRRILEVDTEKLTTGMLEQLIKYLPEPEQIKELGSLKEEYEDLAEAEQFIATVRIGWLRIWMGEGALWQMQRYLMLLS